MVPILHVYVKMYTIIKSCNIYMSGASLTYYYLHMPEVFKNKIWFNEMD